ncbi:MAG: type VII toxin-antitoxin system HepT family RNase toxin [Dissulfuribacterales bacterium]
MVSIEKISRKFIQLEEYLSILAKISDTPGDVFVKDKILVGSAKYYLQVAIETGLDVANHIIAAERFRAPKDYADAFTVLEENNILEKMIGQKLRQMAKFRNRLVHLYGEIDDVFVYEFITNDIEDIKRFRKIIIQRYVS